MFSQPRINDIASLYQGNPGALQQRIQKEQQAKPGLPPDLQKLLALQIITSEQDAMKRNQALQQLQQAGQQPTVAQSVEQKAKQALQSRMLQEQQKQQGLQALAQQTSAGQIPENVPQPERQPEPQGLDQLTSNIGEFAGGGIVAFSGKDRSDVPEASDEEKVREIIERMKREEMERPDYSPEGSISYRSEGIRGAAENAPAEGLGLSSDVPYYKSRGIAESPYVPGAPGMVSIYDQKKNFGPKVPETPAAPAYKIPTSEGLRALAAKPAAPAAPIQPQGIMDEAERQKNLDIIRKRRDLDPEARERVMRERLEKEVGAPDVSSLESLAQEIADRRRKITERADPLRDLLRGIALSPRGERWMFSGARGAEYADRVQAEREAKDFELAQKMFETQAKISDVKRGWKKDLFTIGREEFNTTYKDAFDAAKEMGKSDDAARKMAQDAVLEREKMANQLAASRISAAPQMAAGARIDKAIADLMKNNPEMSYAEAYEAVTKPGGYLSPNKQTLAELKALQASLKDLADPNKNMDQDSQREAARQLAAINAKIAEMAGVDIGNPSVPPPGAVRLKPKQ